MNYLLDTPVVSELARKQPHASVLAWLAAQAEDTLFLSVLTVGELQKGISKLPDSERKAHLALWLAHDLAVRFRERLLPVDVAVALAWGTLQGESLQRGIPLPVIDCLLTATAAVHSLTIVTRNVDDFERCGTTVLDPWKHKSP
jgi:predicted nucleic acid-binding protein